jgi:two-component system, OmpR family, phosphate regulon sensor histidine kinase PhoR
VTPATGRLTEDQLKGSVDRLPQGVIAVDPALKVVYANQASTLFAHPQPLRVGHELPELWRDFSLRAYARSLFSAAVAPRHEVRDQADHTYFVGGIPARSTGIAIVVVENVSGVVRNARAEREFVANAAHELLTPLTGIVTAAFALEAGAKLVAEDRDRFIDHIATEADRLTRIARALLVLARAQSGQEAPRLESVALRPLLEDAVAACDTDHDSAVMLTCPSRLAVFVDRDLAEQALANLLTNAGRHARGAEISVSADEIGEREVGIEVADAGAGLAPAQIDHLADRFYTSAGRDGGGFGLGVSIAAQAIELLGGTLTYVSAPGEGTRARVRFRSGSFANA